MSKRKSTIDNFFKPINSESVIQSDIDTQSEYKNRKIGDNKGNNSEINKCENDTINEIEIENDTNETEIIGIILYLIESKI